jgi:hypothetical protein
VIKAVLKTNLEIAVVVAAADTRDKNQPENGMVVQVVQLTPLVPHVYQKRGYCKHQMMTCHENAKVWALKQKSTIKCAMRLRSCVKLRTKSTICAVLLQHKLFVLCCHSFAYHNLPEGTAALTENTPIVLPVLFCCCDDLALLRTGMGLKNTSSSGCTELVSLQLLIVTSGEKSTERFFGFEPVTS